jgi:hypothetical protein
MIDWKKKLTSRKLWVAVAGFVSGLILAFGGAETTAATVSGCIMSRAWWTLPMPEASRQ